MANHPINLIIDIGNTRIKAGLIEKNELIHFFVFETRPNETVSKEYRHSFHQSFKEASEALLAADFFKKYRISRCVVTSVVDEMGPLINNLKEKVETLVFTSETQTPLVNLYQSVNTLGSDRLAAAVGGSFLFPNKNVLVIDAGTCIKYNFVNSNNEFLGGSISPGLQMRFNALNAFTSRLPLLAIDENFETLIGKNTPESILSGVEIGTVAEIEGIIERYKQLYPDINIVLTGGDAYFFEKRLKSPIFTDSFLILKGLNVILDFNLKGASI